MKLRIGLLWITFVALLALPAWSQSGSTDSQGSADSSQDQSANGPKQVFAHPEVMPPLALFEEATSNSFLDLGMSVSESWNSNAALFATRSRSQSFFTLGPMIRIRQIHPHVFWDVDYSGNLLVTANRYDSMSHFFRSNVLYQFGRRWQMHLSDGYTYTADPFALYLVNPGVPTYNQPNPTVYIPIATTEQNKGSIDVTYKLGAHDSMTFSGFESFRRYLHSSYATYDTYDWGGLAAYQHSFSARIVGGIAYSFTSIDIGHGTSRSGIHMSQAYGSYKLTPRISITGWIGPEITNIKSEIPLLCSPYGCFIEIKHEKAFSVAFGTSASWRGERNAIFFHLSKQVSDGGGLLGIVRLYQADVSLQRRLTPRWNLSLGAGYGNNYGNSPLFRNRRLNNLNGKVSLDRRLGPAWDLRLQYLRLYETQKNIFQAATPTWHANRVQATLQYNWGHSLGR
jgi:hypothetical protein